MQRKSQDQAVIARPRTKMYDQDQDDTELDRGGAALLRILSEVCIQQNKKACHSKVSKHLMTLGLQSKTIADSARRKS